MNSSEVDSFHSEALENFHTRYAGVHGYLSIVVCLFGIPMNLINVTVLTQKHMRTPINCILTWLAVSDVLTMISYVPFALHFYCVNPPLEPSAEKNSLGWMRYLLFHVNFSATTHTISIWLGVTLAIFRYKHIYSPAKGNLTRIRRLIRARIVICIVYVLSTVGLIPNYLTNKIISIPYNNETLYIMEDLKLGTPEVKPVVTLNLWLYSVLAKLVPCVLMAIYGGLLVWTLKSKLRSKRRKLSCSSTLSFRPMDNSRTTRMLLVVIVLYFITEFPQVLLIFLSVTCKGFFRHVYMPLGDMMDMVALINNGINFILYCAMSRDFRNTVVSLARSLFTQRAHPVTINGYSYTCTDSEKSHAALIVRVT